MQIFRSWALLVPLLFSGCQCCGLTETGCDLADAITDHEGAADALYHPRLDLTRIGRRDWCEGCSQTSTCSCRGTSGCRCK